MANLEIVYYLFLALIIVGAILWANISSDGWFFVALASLALLVISVMSIKHGLAGLLAGGFIGFILFAGIAGDNDEGETIVQDRSVFVSFVDYLSNHVTALIVFAAIAIVVGVLIAIYAYKNFDDVVSRRFLYRNSSVSVFEQAWKYAFNRQFAGFMLVFGLFLQVFIICSVSG